MDNVEEGVELIQGQFFDDSNRESNLLTALCVTLATLKDAYEDNPKLVAKIVNKISEIIDSIEIKKEL